MTEATKKKTANKTAKSVEVAAPTAAMPMVVNPTANNISTNDIVNIFVSEYENNLHNKVAELKNQALKLNQTISTKLDALQQTMTTIANNQFNEVGQYTTTNVKGLPSIDVNACKCNVVVMVASTVRRADNTVDSHANFSHVLSLPVDIEACNDIKRVQSELSNVRNDLMKFQQDLSNIGRTERQIRATLSKQALAEFGYDNVVNNEEVRKLITINDSTKLLN